MSIDQIIKTLTSLNDISEKVDVVVKLNEEDIRNIKNNENIRNIKEITSLTSIEQRQIGPQGKLVETPKTVITLHLTR